MEQLLNGLGIHAMLGLVLLGAACLGLGGLALRWQAQRLELHWGLVLGARRPLGEVAAGRVTVIGLWHPLSGGQALVQEGEAGVLVEPGAADCSIREGTRVLVSGFATRRVDHPAGSSYRQSGLVWLLEGAGEPLEIMVDLERPQRQRARGRWFAGIGAVLLGVAVAIAAAGCAVCWQANSAAPVATEDTL